MNSLEIKKNIYYIGATDKNLRVFDIVMHTPFGTTYNSYAVRGKDKTAIFETVKEGFFDEYKKNLEKLGISLKNIDYIIVNHTEPDHAGSVEKLLDLCPKAKIVGSKAAINFLKNIVNKPFESIEVNHNDTLDLGNKTLKFISAPFLHWPDSMFTYLQEDKILISCDAFGAHFSGFLYDDEIDNKDDYLNSLKYYYDSIMSPFKPYILKAVDKIKDLELDMILTGHGPILREKPSEIIKLYKEWSLHEDEENKVSVFYVSAYGYTKSMAVKILEGLKDAGIEAEIFEVTNSTEEELSRAINTSKGLLFGSPTINGDALKPILDLLNMLNPKISKNKYVGAFGSYGWSGEAVPNIINKLSNLKINHIFDGLKINFKPNPEELKKSYDYGKAFAKFMSNKPAATNEKPLKRWKCLICGYIALGEEAPSMCPVCGASKEQFEEVSSGNTSKNGTSETYIIVGNGAAGYYAAKEIRNNNKSCAIKIISAEKYLSYYRPRLSEYLYEKVPNEELLISPKSFYDDKNIELLLGTYVTSINKERKTIFISDGSNIRELSYDKLILANGSNNFIPPVKGYGKEGVFTLKDLKDAEKIRNKISSSKNAVIIGGGLLGLEAAWFMKKSGISVTVIERNVNILPKQLDSKGASLLLSACKKEGINVLTGEDVNEIFGDISAEKVILKSGKEILCDIVLFSVGIVPNKILAEKAGIKTERGIIVNSYMETNIKNIYACGDAAEFNGKVYGNFKAAIEMGKAAGINAASGKKEFKDFVPSSFFNAININLFSCGDISGDLEEIHLENDSSYKKLTFKNGIICGGILIGDTKNSFKIIDMITNHKDIEEAKSFLSL